MTKRTTKSRPIKRKPRRRQTPVQMQLTHTQRRGSQLEVRVQTRWALHALLVIAALIIACIAARPDLAALVVEYLLRQSKP